jgi:hypothetical protein
MQKTVVITQHSEITTFTGFKSPSEDGNENVVLLKQVHFPGPLPHLVEINLTLIDILSCAVAP